MATPKQPRKRRSKKSDAAMPAFAPDEAPDLNADMIAVGSTDDPDKVPAFDPLVGALEIPGDDGTITIQLGEPEKPKKPSGFEDNIADDVDPFELTRIANDLLEGIEQDDRSRSEWL